MKEALFILLVMVGLIGLTAFRYRKQIAHLLGFARMLKEIKNNLSPADNKLGPEIEKGVALVNCSTCGIWVPQNRARRGADLFYCSDQCFAAKTVR